MHPADLSSSRREILQRTRLILGLSAGFALVFALRELVDPAQPLGARFAVRVVGIALAVVGIAVLRARGAVRHARPLAVATIAVAYALTALAGIASPTAEYGTTAILFVGAALTTATVVPWGVAGQVGTVVIGAASLCAAVMWKDRGLHALASDPAAAVAMGFGLSVATAATLARYRAAHRRERIGRIRAHAALGRLNARLEQRVADRTAALAATNRQLADEVAERRRAARALRAAQAQLVDTIDNSTALIWLKDLEGRYLLVNREFERVLGVPRMRVIGRTDAELFAIDLAARMAAHDDAVRAGGAPVSFEQALPLAGAPRTFVCAKFPLRGPEGTPYGIGCMATDITLVKQLQESLRLHEAELAHVLRLHTIGEMAATLAHEINQPLGAIANYAHGGAQRLRAGAGGGAELLDAFDAIGREALRAGRILRDVRALVARESGDASSFELNALAEEAARVIEPHAREYGIAVRVDPAAGVPPVRGNRTQIEQVMVNLLLNGVQAIAGAGSRRREVVLATSRGAHAVEVAVTDTGPGIAPGMAHKLFTPFVTSKARGLGLGLAISRSIVERHGGRLWTTPNRGSGATFRFTLPIAARPDFAAPDRRAS
jgi:PAS domain S-box-containing protein